MVCELLANGSRIKCAYVWMGLQTCAAPSANSLHTIRRKPKFANFLHEHKENWMHRVSFPCTGRPLLASGLQKINKLHAAYTPQVNGATCKRHTRVYKALPFH